MFFESLESRTLMSVSAVNLQIVEDRLQVRADLLKFRYDIASYTLTLFKDCQTLKKDDVGQDSTLAPLFAQLHADVKVMHQQLCADRMAEGAAVLKDQSTLCHDLRLIILDKGNASVESTNFAQLLTDRIQLQNDELTGLNARLATRQTDYTTIFNDLNAITTAVESDSSASSQVQADVQKFITDRTNCLNTMTADIQQLITDRTQLVNDLTALES